MPCVSPSRAWLGSTLAPLPAIALGAAVAAGHGVAWSAYAPNLAAVVVGLAVLAALEHAPREWLARWAPPLAALGVAATLLGAGLDGVHRWLSLGGLSLNLSAALTPWILLGLAASEPRTRTSGLLAATVVQLVHLAQPDAGQATALAAGAAPWLLAAARARQWVVALPLLVLVALAGAAWLRADPLLPIDHVERVLSLAAARGAGWSLACMAAAAALLAPLAQSSRPGRPDLLGASLVSYQLAAFAVTWLGHFPVPVFGAGAGTVLGWYALRGVRTRTAN